MKVSELILKLKELNQDFDIVLVSDRGLDEPSISGPYKDNPNEYWMG